MSTEAIVDLSNIYKKYIIVMQTINRGDNKNLLPETIKSMQKSGLWESSINFHFIVHDSSTGENPSLECLHGLDKTTIIRNNEFPNQLGNTYSSLKYVQENFLSDYIISIEDDIIFCKNWIENIDKWLSINSKDDDIFFSFFTPYNHTKILYDCGASVWDEYKIQDFYGNQCICIKHNQLFNLCYILKEYIDKKSVLCSDILLHDWLEKHGHKQTLKASCPCLVQHRNLFSTQEHKAIVLSTSFLGEDIDPKFYE